MQNFNTCTENITIKINKKRAVKFSSITEIRKENISSNTYKNSDTQSISSKWNIRGPQDKHKGTKREKYFLRIFMNTKIKIDDNPIVDAAISEYKLSAMSRRNTSSSKRYSKVRLEVDSLEKWLKILDLGIYIGNRHYIAEPWIFSPKQCQRCASLEHVETDCNYTEKCLICTSEKHTSKDCVAKKEQQRCLNCGNNHTSYSRSCNLIQSQQEKCNRSYINLLRNNDMLIKFQHLFAFDTEALEKKISSTDDQMPEIEIRFQEIEKRLKSVEVSQSTTDIELSKIKEECNKGIKLLSVKIDGNQKEILDALKQSCINNVFSDDLPYTNILQIPMHQIQLKQMRGVSLLNQTLQSNQENENAPDLSVNATNRKKINKSLISLTFDKIFKTR